MTPVTTVASNRDVFPNLEHARRHTAPHVRHRSAADQVLDALGHGHGGLVLSL
jgi:hypothetical protein